eukprot:scaffold48639_cov54-Phaeocystis_antarctica.AAC.2
MTEIERPDGLLAATHPAQPHLSISLGYRASTGATSTLTTRPYPRRALPLGTFGRQLRPGLPAGAAALATARTTTAAALATAATISTRASAGTTAATITASFAARAARRATVATVAPLQCNRLSRCNNLASWRVLQNTHNGHKFCRHHNGYKPRPQRLLAYGVLSLDDRRSLGR